MREKGLLPKKPLRAESGEELHAMAARLGSPRRFVQDHPGRWHHVLPKHLRDRAVALGAREVTMHEVGALLRRRRAEVLRDGPDQPIG